MPPVCRHPGQAGPASGLGPKQAVQVHITSATAGCPATHRRAPCRLGWEHTCRAGWCRCRAARPSDTAASREFVGELPNVARTYGLEPVGRLPPLPYPVFDSSCIIETTITIIHTIQHFQHAHRGRAPTCMAVTLAVGARRRVVSSTRAADRALQAGGRGACDTWRSTDTPL